ncbi:hypothetical protein Tco_0823236 [Tanacetum coccineum]|uniref:Uncharacterized protein n=1 Tax=Tanacetum coccineum TaxID=301880 RepID=A0ABQ5AKM9_9ASTR
MTKLYSKKVKCKSGHKQEQLSTVEAEVMQCTNPCTTGRKRRLYRILRLFKERSGRCVDAKREVIQAAHSKHFMVEKCSSPVCWTEDGEPNTRSRSIQRPLRKIISRSSKGCKPLRHGDPTEELR